MGIFSVPVTIRNLAQPDREQELSLMVDTGSLIERKYGYLEVGYQGHSGAMNVVFGEAGDMEVLGVTALEAG